MYDSVICYTQYSAYQVHTSEEREGGAWFGCAAKWPVRAAVLNAFARARVERTRIYRASCVCQRVYFYAGTCVLHALRCS